MGKKILGTNYTINSDSDKIVVKGYYKAEQFQLITDVTPTTGGTILYNFADATKGHKGVTFDTVEEETTIHLETDLSGLSIDSNSKLQIIVDHPENEVEVSDALLDPVHKIRVSTPENLIDTDFEYGLQPTKWETLELSNNVPSFYIADGDTALDIVDRVLAQDGSDIIKVECNDAHNLVVGTPIDVSGLDFRTAEGKFLISSADSNNFYYRANAEQTITGEIGSLYTAITPGSFYAGSQIPYNLDSGLTTDGARQSTVSIETPDIHGFVEKSNFYMVNTVASKTLRISDSGKAADDVSFVDPRNTIDADLSLDLSKTHTTEIRSRWSNYFGASDINVSNDTITWPNHRLRTNYTLLYCPPAGGAPIGGLARLDFYYVIYVDDNTIKLASTYNGTAISFSSTGGSSVGLHSLHLVYEIRYTNATYRNSYTYNYHWSYYYGANASGYDLRTYEEGSYGLGPQPDGTMVMVRQYAMPSYSARYITYYTPQYDRYSGTAYGGNGTYWRFPESDPSAATDEPSRFNIMEDFTRFRNYNWSGYNAYYHPSYIRTRKYYYHGTYRYTWGNKRIFIMPFIYDTEADTFFSENHGLTTGQSIQWNTVSGSAPTIHGGSTAINNANANTTLADGTYNVEVPSPDRFRISGKRIVMAPGDSDGAYQLTANVKNPNANSFFVADHGLISNQAITFGTDGSPTLPSTDSGQLLPDWQEGENGNNPLIFKIVDDYLNDTYFPALTGHTADMLTSTHEGNSNIIANSGRASGTSAIQYINNWYTTSYTEFYINNSRTTYGYPSSTASHVGRFNKTSAVNLFSDQAASLRSKGLVRLATPWQSNTQIPYYLELNFASDAAHENDNNNDNWWRFYNYSYTRINNVGNSQWRYQAYNKTGATTGDQYKYEFSLTYAERSSSGFVQLNFVIDNTTSWSTYNNAAALYSYVYGNSSYSIHYDFSYMKDTIQGRLWFMGDNTIDYNTTKAKTLMDAIVDQIDANFNKVGLTNGTEYKVAVINTDRFSINTGGATVDLTDSGSGYNDSNGLKFSLKEIQGAADGAFLADSVGENLIKLKLPFEVGGNAENFDAGNIDSDDNIIPISGGHPFLSGTKVTYDVTTGSELGGLTDGTDYYVYAVDDNNIQLMNDLQDAIVGSNPVSINSDSASAVHTISTKSIAGRTKAEGTVSTTAGSKKVTGTQTLFKRYFKAGDKIFVKDDTNDPGDLYEYTIGVISDDENMELASDATVTVTDQDHFVVTNVYTKPDGYSVHRPFDGGVEIAAGTAPLSQITRQTRKYFRYQSGKGIQTSLAINFNPPVILETITSNGTTVRCKTKYPHRLTVGMNINVVGATDENYNGDQEVATVVDDYNFTYTATNAPNQSIPGGIVQYTVSSYSGSYVRAGMFDNQNGFFFEWDGDELHCVRRSSTTQLSGTVQATKNSGLIVGTDTNFSGQLVKNDKIVIRGQTYKVVKIEDRTNLYVQPQYRGVSTDGIILTKTEDVRVPQSQWNLDKCDGSGKEGFNLDTTKIQMAYMDYSWYGAGKIRFGFKDRKGHVRYAHEFIHNNRLDEAYMRSGNLPAKYEIENDENPTYAPTLFHWGTSVIMDGTFDDDKAYLFTAPSKNLTFTNGQANTATTAGASSLIYRYNRSKRTYDWYVRIPFNTSDASKFSTGTKLYTADNALDGHEVNYTDYGSSQFRVHIYITSGWSSPGSYPSVQSSVVVNIGQPATGGDDIQLGTDIIPLVSLRLAPSVDNNLTGNLGERDIINRMQLKLNEVGLILTHDCEVKLILNGDISTVTWENVKAPSLSQLIKHDQGDQITGGTEVFSFRAAGGASGASNTSNFSLGDLIDMGNSILGGDGIFPNGPDILTVAVQVVDTAGINATTPFTASSRITWAESQA